MAWYTSMTRFESRLMLAVAVSAVVMAGGGPARADDVRDHFNKGVALFREKKVDAALDEMTLAQKGSPNDPTILYWVGFLDLQLRRYADAVDPLERAVKAKKDVADAHLNLGNVYDALKRYSDAVGEFEKAGQLAPKSPDAYYNEGGVYLKMHKAAEAITAYKKAVAISPGDAEIQNGLGFALQTSGDCEAAVSAYERAIKLQPTWANFYLNRAVALEEIVARMPRVVDGKRNPDVAATRADICATLAKAAELSPQSFPIREAYAEALFDTGKVAESVPQFQKAAELEPGQYNPVYNLGLAESKLGEIARAVDAYTKAVKLGPNNPEALQGLGMAYFKLGKYEDAAKQFGQLSTLTPTDMTVWLNLSLCQQREGDASAATATLREALKHVSRGPKAGMVRRALAGRLYLKGGATDLQEAEAEYLRSLDDAPDNAEALNALGLISEKLHKPDDALTYFKRAVAVSPKFADAWNNMGVAYEAKGNVSAALASYRKAAEVDPGNKLALRNLARYGKGSGASAQ